MERKPQLSIVIPVYNTEKYLEKCLKSIVSQTYENLEIICVDDGSTDESGNILEEFGDNDSRIIVVHQKNCGESRARNVGLEMASGEYITLVDSDDWLEPTMYNSLISAAIECDADIAIGGWIKESGSSSEVIKNSLQVEENIFGRDRLLEYLYKRDSYRAFAYMWDKIYKREIISPINEKPVRFNDELSLGGDVQFLAEVALQTKKAVYIDEAFYHYRQLEESMCHTKDLNRWRDWIKSYEIIIDEFKEENIDKKIIGYLKRFLAYHACEATEVSIKQNNIAMTNEFRRIMREYKNEYVHLNRDYPERINWYIEVLNRGN